MSASTAYTYRVTIKYLPSGVLSPSNGNGVDLDVTTPALSDVGAPINFKVTNATLTDGVYVLASHHDDPILDWEYTPITITETDDDILFPSRILTKVTTRPASSSPENGSTATPCAAPTAPGS